MTRIDVHLQMTEGPVDVGRADVQRSRGVTATRFAYGRSFLAEGGWDLSPDLPVTATEAVVEGLPGAFEDSAPDAWGRNLIARRLAREWAGHGAPAPSDVDYLLGASDLTRQGALRFSVGDGFLAEGSDVPRLVDLQRLLDAASAVAVDDAADDAVTALLDAGSGSLGGARPKASLIDGGALHIAKFPHVDDRWDVMRWEAVALDLAKACGFEVPDHRLVVVGRAPVLVVRRFDRRGAERLSYLSGRSLVGGGPSSGDYLDLVEAITDHGSDVEADLAELWRRLAFSIAINNTDDHLRNHGFLRRRGGWTMSPVFDVNPNPNPRASRVMGIRGETAPDDCHRALFETAEHFRLGRAEAEHHWRQIVEGVAAWRDVAADRGLRDEEVDRFVSAFDRWTTER